MIHNASFRRKVAYMALIALLLIPLYMIGNPATGDPTDPDSTPGGRLAQLRAEYDLSQAELGEIDPTSESMKLATLGLRGVATNILWTKANKYKRLENWEQLIATVNQMAKLQPNFISVWEFQSHNLSYNVSVEHDDYRFRYEWVKKGIDFLIEGTRYNRREPKLFWSAGWFTGQKFGRADEREQFRRLFADDEDFHLSLAEHIPVSIEANGPNGKPDSWLVSKLWYGKAYNIADTQGVPIRGRAPHIFFIDGPKAQMNYANAIEGEGYLNERAEEAWRLGGVALDAYSRRLFPTSWGEHIRLAEEEQKIEEAKRLKKELDELVPGAREEIYQEKFAKLSPSRQSLLEKGTYTPNEYSEFMLAQYETDVSHLEVAERAPAEVRSKAFRIAKQAAAAETTADRIDRYRENVNFEYWRSRCQVEQMADTVQARLHMFRANERMDEVLLSEARKEYEAAWEKWAAIFEQFPELVQQQMSFDLIDEIQRYVDLLAQLDEELPEDFVLQELIEFQTPKEWEMAADAEVVSE